MHYNSILSELKSRSERHLKILEGYMNQEPRDAREFVEYRPFENVSYSTKDSVMKFDVLSHSFMIRVRYCSTLRYAIVSTYVEEFRVGEEKIVYTYFPEMDFSISTDGDLEFAVEKEYSYNQKMHFEKNLPKNYFIRLTEIIQKREKEYFDGVMKRGTVVYGSN